MARPERLRAWDALSRPFVTPSLLNCDFAKVGEEIAHLERAGAVAFHLDVMDGHFVPNLSYGAPVIRDWRKHTELPFDTHLMISEPARYLDDFVAAGCDTILFHIEVVPDPTELCRRIHDHGCHAGLVMSVMPGFGGQKFEREVLAKVRALRAARPNLNVSIDGGIKPDTAAEATAAGASQLVVGSAMFPSDGNYAAALAKLAEGARRGLSNPPSSRGEGPVATAGPASPA